MQRVQIGLFVLALAGCATTPKEPVPDWVIRPQERYPLNQYLSAVGEGDTRRAAENSAAAGLARIFEAKIQSNETLTETTTEARGTQTAFDQLSELRANIRVGSDQDLLNIQFGESFTGSDGRVYVVAFLPRAETAEIYRTRISEIGKSIVHLVRQSDADAEPLKKYAFRRAAVRNALKNDRLLAQLDIIAPGARKQIPLHYDPQTLYSETAAAAHAVTFSVEELPEAMRGVLAEELTGMGFSEKNEYPTFNFSGTVEFEESDLRRGSLVFVRYRFVLGMRTPDGRLALALNGSRREGHLSFEEADARARRSLQVELGSLIPRKLGDYLDRLAPIK